MLAYHLGQRIVGFQRPLRHIAKLSIRSLGSETCTFLSVKEVTVSVSPSTSIVGNTLPLQNFLFGTARKGVGSEDQSVIVSD